MHDAAIAALGLDTAHAALRLRPRPPPEAVRAAVEDALGE